jgi:hypothetical protein
MAWGVTQSSFAAIQTPRDINQSSNNPLPLLSDVEKFNCKGGHAFVFAVAVENPFDFFSGEYRALFENSR